MSNEDYLVAGIRQQINALQRLLQELRSESADPKKVIPRIRAIETKLKSLRDSTGGATLAHLP